MQYLGTKHDERSVAGMGDLPTVRLNGTAKNDATLYAPTTKGAIGSTTTIGVCTHTIEEQALHAGAEEPQWVTYKQTTIITLPSDNTSNEVQFDNTLETADVCVSCFFQEGGYWKQVVIDVAVTSSTVLVTFDEARTSQTFKIVIIR